MLQEAIYSPRRFVPVMLSALVLAHTLLVLAFPHVYILEISILYVYIHVEWTVECSNTRDSAAGSRTRIIRRVAARE